MSKGKKVADIVSETLHTDGHPFRARVYRLTGGEFRVTFWWGMSPNPDADYYTNDREDAMNTAQHWINSRARGGAV